MEERKRPSFQRPQNLLLGSCNRRRLGTECYLKPGIRVQGSCRASRLTCDPSRSWTTGGVRLGDGRVSTLAGKFWPLPRTPAPRPRPCPRHAHLCVTGSVFSPISPYSTESSSFLPLKTSNPAHTLTTPNLCFRPELCLYSYFPAPRAPEVPGVSGQTHVSSSDRPLTPHFPEASQPSPLAQARN